MPPFVPASLPSVAAFVVIVVTVVAAFLAGVRHVWRDSPRMTWKTAAVLAVWLGGVCAAVASGMLAALPMSGIPFFFGAILLVSVGAGLSPFGGRLGAGLPLAALVAFQGFRLPLELVLHAWVDQGTIPGTMTWTGRNWDIATGIVALFAAPIAGRYRLAAWVANGVGALLLLNVMRVALLSAPVPFGWPVDPPLMVALHLPYALIGPVCVGGALFGHIVLTRRLLGRT